ncbi:MAG: PD-(D/E)XK nuclease family protein [Phycisphaerales bacterium]|nr:PD-(D/E)XK nuclease family protein [Phycisphaerales bacterium]
MSETAILAPNDEALCHTGRDHLSWSQCQAYLRCPWAYQYRYVEAAEPEFTPSALVFGSAIHECLRRHHTAQLEGTEAPAMDGHRELIAASLGGADPPIRFGTRDDADSMITLGTSMLEAFVASELATPQGRIVAIEEPVRGTLDDSIPDLEGYVDLVFEQDGQLVIRDYKTTRSAWGAGQVREAVGQLVIYGALMTPTTKADRTVSLEFVTITKQRAPKVKRLEASGEDEDKVATVTTVVTQLRNIWTGISAGAFPARPGWNCATCPYQARCPHSIA